MLNLGLLGNNIQHSKSSLVYRHLLGDLNYRLFDVESPPALEKLWPLDGLSVTAPFKREYLDRVDLDDMALRCRSVNTIRYRDGWEGSNTDYLALRDIFVTDLVKYTKIYVYLLGNGVMADISKVIFDELSIEFEQFYRQRDGDISKLNIQAERTEQIIVVNSCDRRFYFQGKISDSVIFFDYNYGVSYPFKRFRDGTDLLVRQAKYAISFWKI